MLSINLTYLSPFFIGIVYGANCLETSEGRPALELAVRILSRLYPNITFCDLNTNNEGEGYVEKLKLMATEINPEINISDGQTPTVNLVIGDVPGIVSEKPCIYIGSSNWVAYYSSTVPRPCTKTHNPFGGEKQKSLSSGILPNSLQKTTLKIFAPPKHTALPAAGVGRYEIVTDLRMNHRKQSNNCR
ncbi:E2 ligase fold family C protein [Daejeonella sp.]|uniref:E2 ligase fold family C protein n=1 Tax=Daejeonella sp. TaxID=2805397 RepID=UPI003C718AD7